MASADPLVRLLAALQASPLLYLADSGIDSYPGAEPLRRALAGAAADQRRVIERAEAVLAEREVAPPRTAYPLAYTAWHDLTLEHLVPRVVAGLRGQLPELEAVAAGAADDATAAGLAAEAGHAARRHVEALERLAAAPAAT